MRSANLSINTSPAKISAATAAAAPGQVPTPASNSNAVAHNNGNGKQRDVVAADQIAIHETAGDRNAQTATDLSKDFLTTLATLLDEGATIEAKVVDNPVNVSTPVGSTINESLKTEEALEEAGAAMVEAMLSGVQLSTSPAATTVSETARTAVSDMAAVTPHASPAILPIAGFKGDVSVLGVVTTATATSSIVNDIIDHTTDVSKNTEQASPNPTTGSELAVADVRSGKGGEVREQASLESRVGTAKWTDELAARVTLFSQRDIHSASLRLSPEHLGPLEIQISVQNDKTSVWFGAAHAETRAALEQALPRLRELLSSQGLVLTDSGVFREPPRDQTRGYQAQNTLTTATDAVEIDARLKVNRSLLDAYA